ncbi:unnamed protein product [Lactuca saligna]|uniref:Lipoyl-binding domain-containing protein n=1 Tax=Lactuca saligna TaxID=75948 RepID=A0AA36A163_LACSI|nr:unnamed protein product [Lactuca saligna]
MESAAVLRSFHCTVSPLRSSFERPGVVSMHNASWIMSTKSLIQTSSFSLDLLSSQKRRTGAIVSCIKSSDVTVADKSNGSVEKTTSPGSFPIGFEELVIGVCDETQIAELKMKIGGFEMHLKRNIKSTGGGIVVASPTVAPPIPSEPMTGSTLVAPPLPPKPAQKPNPFTNVPVEKLKKLAALEASGATGYVLVSCPTVGTFRESRTLKGKKQPILCKEGDMIKEGQTICYLDQFGTELPVKSDASGEVIKILFNDGEAVGYGDPLIAVLPSFHDIK